MHFFVPFDVLNKKKIVKITFENFLLRANASTGNDAQKPQILKVKRHFSNICHVTYHKFVLRVDVVFIGPAKQLLSLTTQFRHEDLGIL